MTSVKRFPRAAVSFLLLAAALFLFSASAFADYQIASSGVAFQDAATGALDFAAGSAIDGALGALGVKIGLGTGALLTTWDLIQSVISGTPLGVVDYQYNGSFYDLADQSTIRIRDDVVTIDGVDYKDVWLPHDAAAKFRVNAFDFITFYNIVSESSGTYASGVGFCGKTPMYSVDGVITSQRYFCKPGELIPNFYEGSIRSTYDSQLQAYDFRYIATSISSRIYAGRLGASFWIARDGDIFRAYGQQPGYNYFNFLSSTNIVFTPSSFDFDWVSSSIPSEPFPDDQGLRLRVPASYVAGIPSTLDPSLADYSTYLKSLGDALEQARLADAVESTAFEEYDAPAPPVPSTGTIAEEPYSSLDGSLTGIQDSLDNIDTNIGTVDESLDDIQVYAEDAADSLQSIDTNLSQSVADTAGIKGFIQQFLPGVHSLLNSISTSVSNIAGSVAAADETFFGNVVDAIVAPFTPVFDIFKSGVGIWRYVVAWVGNISAPFSWIWSTLSQANGILVSPILASAAAAVVLAVYKRFGR